jgi:hypothetical protein
MLYNVQAIYLYIALKNVNITKNFQQIAILYIRLHPQLT